MTRVFIFAQCPLFARGIAALLQEERGIAIVGIQSKADALLSHIVQAKPDTIIVGNGKQRGDTGSITDTVLRTGLVSNAIELDSADNCLYICSREHRPVTDISDLIEALEGLAETIDGLEHTPGPPGDAV